MSEVKDGCTAEKMLTDALSWFIKTHGTMNTAGLLYDIADNLVGNAFNKGRLPRIFIPPKNNDGGDDWIDRAKAIATAAALALGWLTIIAILARLAHVFS